MSKTANKKVKISLAQATNSVRNKFQQLRNEHLENDRLLEEQYSPITKRLGRLIDSATAVRNHANIEIKPVKQEKRRLKRQHVQFDFVNDVDDDASAAVDDDGGNDFEMDEYSNVLTDDDDGGASDNVAVNVDDDDVLKSSKQEEQLQQQQSKNVRKSVKNVKRTTVKSQLEREIETRELRQQRRQLQRQQEHKQNRMTSNDFDDSRQLPLRRRPELLIGEMSTYHNNNHHDGVVRVRKRKSENTLDDLGLVDKDEPPAKKTTLKAKYHLIRGPRTTRKRKADSSSQTKIFAYGGEPPKKKSTTKAKYHLVSGVRASRKRKANKKDTACDEPPAKRVTRSSSKKKQKVQKRVTRSSSQSIGMQNYSGDGLPSAIDFTTKEFHNKKNNDISVGPCANTVTYWDDPNELVDRLRLLVSSTSAGHTGHNNEIISILEELREARIIQ
jgi:hypothetical protein